MSCFRKVPVRAVIAAVLAAAGGGCNAPWYSDTIYVDPIDRTRVRQDATVVLRQAAEDPNPLTRYLALQEMPKALGAAGGAVCKQALDDPDVSVRVAAATAIGDIRYAPARTKLQRMAQYKTKGAERDTQAYCAVIYALHRLGDDTHTSDLGTFLFDRDNVIRANAAEVMGKMRLRAGIAPLRAALAEASEHALKLEIMLALARCGDKRSLRRIEAYTRGQFVDEQIIAVSTMAELKSPMCETMFTSLFTDDPSPRVKVAAVGGLAALGRRDKKYFDYCVRATMEPEKVMREALEGRRVPTKEEMYSVQQMAARSLRNFDHPLTANILAGILKSPSPAVRIASAAGILIVVPRAAVPKAVDGVRKPVGDPKTGPASKPGGPRLHTSGAKD